MPASRQIYFVNANEVLTGFVNGQKASDIEERFAVALMKLQIPFTFRARINPLVGLTEDRENIIGEVEIDFMCEYLGRIYVFNIQGEISHFFTASQQIVDQKKEAKIDAALKVYNAHPLIKIPFTLLRTQEQADRLARSGFMNGWPQQSYYQV